MTDISAIAATSNLTTATESVSPADKMFYKSNGKNQALGVRSVELTFDDVVDMLNPLQHIPVLSSLYRAIIDDDINPVSRIAGDTLYGGVMGIGSACMSAATAAADEIMAANAGGSASDILVSALSGSEATQVASADIKPSATEETKVAALQTPVPQVPVPSMPGTNATSSDAVKTRVASGAPASSDKSFALDRSKQPYGGVMDTALMANAQQNQALALAMTGQSQVLQAQRNLRNSRFAAAVPAAAAAVESAANHATAMEPQTQAAMHTLLQELHKMKAIDAYQNAAAGAPAAGGSVDVVN